MNRCCKSRKRHLVAILLVIVLVIYYCTVNRSGVNLDLEITRRDIERTFEEALKEDKGTGCNIPKVDPFAKEIMQFDVDFPQITCPGQDWVRCYMSQCKINPDIQNIIKKIKCSYRDIVYQNDDEYYLSPPSVVKEGGVYHLKNSDHVRIMCIGTDIKNNTQSEWVGFGAGLRSTVKPQQSPPGREDSINVLIFAFDSTSKNSFIRNMPHSYKLLKHYLNATILNGYNILGDATTAAILPLLTGKTELELPESRKSVKGSGYTDKMPLIFYKLKEDGYRTSFLEDSPWMGTFQLRFNGFQKQPADHYLWAFYLEHFRDKGYKEYCVGDTPQYKFMMNLTEQFFKQDGKKFAFTFIVGISHDDNRLSSADNDLVHFLRSFEEQGFLKNTLLFVMGDHGPRYSSVRNTFQGKLEERLPLMAIVLPDKLKRERPAAAAALAANADVLTTPHDVHATVLDAMGLTRHWNPYKIKGADLTRALTLFQPIPRNRSCSEAGIEPHWCACVTWSLVSATHPLFRRVAQELVNHINDITLFQRDVCVERKLKNIEWVMKRVANTKMLSFRARYDPDGYIGEFGSPISIDKDIYQVRIEVGPGKGLYEATVSHFLNDDSLTVNTREISRTNAYSNEPSCISDRFPRLNMYCYCRQYLKDDSTK